MYVCNYARVCTYIYVYTHTHIPYRKTQILGHGEPVGAGPACPWTQLAGRHALELRARLSDALVGPGLA